MMTASGLPSLAALAAGLLLFAIALVVARWRRPREAGGRRDRLSVAGIVVQASAFVIVAGRGTRVTLDPLGAPALAAAGITAILLGVALTLFVWSTATLGRNWSLVARMRPDHALVTSGPFALMRHPIYTALGLVVIAVGIALGHGPALLLALPLYALGTTLRVRVEERMLRATFGPAYEAYATHVKRFVPQLF